MFVIAGVSGHTGSVAADALLAQGKKVRVVVRDAAKGETWKARGADVAVASVDDAVSLARAFDGAEGAYVLLPPDVQAATPLEDGKRRTTSIAAAVKTARLPHLVLLSSVGAQHEDGTGMIRTVHFAEQELSATGTALTAIRAAYFMENWEGSLGMVGQGVLPTFLPPALSFPQVATRDIGLTAARALAEGPQGSQIVQLAGPRDYSTDEVAAVIAKLAGKPVKAQQGPLEAVVPTFTSFGMSPAVAELFREMYAGLASGRVAFAPDTDGPRRTRTVRGTTPLEDVLRRALGR
jgi:uncharacterized protein YbjT (DUF2867 family)